LLNGRILAGIFVLSIVVVQTSIAQGAPDCREISYLHERQALSRKLARNAFSEDQTEFLLANAERKLRELRSRGLSDNAASCGIEKIRAHVLRCIDQQLSGMLRKVRGDPSDKINKPMWGKQRPTSRELIFIGVFHACRGAAAELIYD